MQCAWLLVLLGGVAWADPQPRRLDENFYFAPEGDVGVEESSGRNKRSVTYTYSSDGRMTGYRYSSSSSVQTTTVANYWIEGVNYQADGSLNFLGKVYQFPASGKLSLGGMEFLKDKKIVVNGKSYNYGKMVGGGGASSAMQVMGSYWIGGVAYLPDGTLSYLGQVHKFPASGKLILGGITFLKDRQVIVNGKTYNYKNGGNTDMTGSGSNTYWIQGVNYLDDGTLKYQGKIYTFPANGRLVIGGMTFTKDREVIINGKTYIYKGTVKGVTIGNQYWINGVVFLSDGTLSYQGKIYKFPASGKIEIDGYTFTRDRQVIVDGKTYGYSNTGKGSNYVRPDTLPAQTTTTATYWMGGVIYLADGTLSYLGEIKQFPPEGRLTLGGITFLKNRQVIVNGKTYNYNNAGSTTLSTTNSYWIVGVKYMPDGSLSFRGKTYEFPANGRLEIAGMTFTKDKQIIIDGKTYTYNSKSSAAKGVAIGNQYWISGVVYLADGSLSYQGKVYKFPESGKVEIEGYTFLKDRQVIVDGKTYVYSNIARGGRGPAAIKSTYWIGGVAYLPDGTLSYLGEIHRFPDSGKLILGGVTFLKNNQVIVNGKTYIYNNAGNTDMSGTSKYWISNVEYLADGTLSYRGKIYKFPESGKIDIGGIIFTADRQVVIGGKTYLYSGKTSAAKGVATGNQYWINGVIFLSDGTLSYQGKILKFNPEGKIVIDGYTFLKDGRITVNGKTYTYSNVGKGGNVQTVTAVPSTDTRRTYWIGGVVYLNDGRLSYQGKIYQFPAGGQIVLGGVTFFKDRQVMVNGKTYTYSNSGSSGMGGGSSNTYWIGGVYYKPDGTLYYRGKTYKFVNGKVEIGGITFTKDKQVIINGVTYTYKGSRSKGVAYGNRYWMSGVIYLKDGTLSYQGEIHKFPADGKLNLNGVTFLKDRQVIVNGRTYVFSNTGKTSPSTGSNTVIGTYWIGGVAYLNDGTLSYQGQIYKFPETGKLELGGVTFLKDRKIIINKKTYSYSNAGLTGMGGSTSTYWINGVKYLKDGTLSYRGKIYKFGPDGKVTIAGMTFNKDGTVIVSGVKYTYRTSGSAGFAFGTSYWVSGVIYLDDGSLSHQGKIYKFPSDGKITLDGITYLSNRQVIVNGQTYTYSNTGKVGTSLDTTDKTDDGVTTAKVGGNYWIGGVAYLTDGTLSYLGKIHKFSASGKLELGGITFFKDKTVLVNGVKYTYNNAGGSSMGVSSTTYWIRGVKYLPDGSLSFQGKNYKFGPDGKVEIAGMTFTKDKKIIINGVTYTYRTSGSNGFAFGSNYWISGVLFLANGSLSYQGKVHQFPSDGKLTIDGITFLNNRQVIVNGKTYTYSNRGRITPKPSIPYNYGSYWIGGVAYLDDGTLSHGGKIHKFPKNGQLILGGITFYKNKKVKVNGKMYNYKNDGSASMTAGSNTGSNDAGTATSTTTGNAGTSTTTTTSTYWISGVNYMADGTLSYNGKTHKFGPDGKVNIGGIIFTKDKKVIINNKTYAWSSESSSGVVIGDTFWISGVIFLSNGSLSYHGKILQFPADGKITVDGYTFFNNRQILYKGKTYTYSNSGEERVPMKEEMQSDSPDIPVVNTIGGFQRVTIDTPPKTKDKVMLAKQRPNNKDRNTALRPWALAAVDETLNEQIVTVYTTLQQSSGKISPNELTNLRNRIKPTILTIMRNAVSKMSDGVCKCGGGTCYCCANMGTIGSGCILAEVYNPDSQPGVDVRVLKGDSELASITIQQGGSQMGCFDIVPYLIQGCIKQTSFSLQDGTLVGCFTLDIPVLKASGKYCVTHTEGGDACITGSPFKG